ncbi:hypothetical protein L596_001215 [Steinernema carpocapsae]|uniref:Uncharacterized protein n=1 Tax=Steinernema carpocapsae TaxID=34508 RepID=A0A4U8UL56_STECR|nr:hypothetical protein L596_001215 [Steinernema carpocapsae]
MMNYPFILKASFPAPVKCCETERNELATFIKCAIKSSHWRRRDVFVWCLKTSIIPRWPLPRSQRPANHSHPWCSFFRLLLLLLPATPLIRSNLPPPALMSSEKATTKRWANVSWEANCRSRLIQACPLFLTAFAVGGRCGNTSHSEREQRDLEWGDNTIYLCN